MAESSSWGVGEFRDRHAQFPFNGMQPLCEAGFMIQRHAPVLTPPPVVPVDLYQMHEKSNRSCRNVLAAAAQHARRRTAECILPRGAGSCGG